MTTIVTVRPDTVDVVCLGESMVTFLPTRPGRLADVPSFDRGHRRRGVQRGLRAGRRRAHRAVGQPGRRGRLRRPPGRGDRGVRRRLVGRAARLRRVRPASTSVRRADRGAPDAHEVVYYRAGSAASAMSRGDRGPGGGARRRGCCTCPGSRRPCPTDCLALLRALTAPRRGRPLVSFDVNHRAGLWRDADGPRRAAGTGPRRRPRLRRRGRGGGGVGRRGGADAIRAALPEPGVLVVKQGARRAPPRTSAADVGRRRHHVPAPWRRRRRGRRRR